MVITLPIEYSYQYVAQASVVILLSSVCSLIYNLHLVTHRARWYAGFKNELSAYF